MADGKEKSVADLSYEEAVAELEKLVERMDGGRLTLDETIEAYSRGTALARICREKLDAAERKIEKLNAEGQKVPVSDGDLRDEADGSPGAGRLGSAAGPRQNGAWQPPAKGGAGDDIPF